MMTFLVGGFLGLLLGSAIALFAICAFTLQKEDMEDDYEETEEDPDDSDG